MIKGTRRRETNGTCLDSFAGKPAHRGDVICARLVAVRAALSHHIDPQRGMRHLGREVDIELLIRQALEIIRKALPVPGQPISQHREGNIFHALHQAD